MQLHVLIRYGTLINNVWMTKSELRIKQMGLPLIISNVTNDIKWTLQNLGSQVFKNHNFNPFQSSSLSIRASVAVAMLFIPSSHVLSSYFLCFTQFGGSQHYFNFDKFHDTAPLQKRRKKRKEGRKKERMNERKKEGKKPCLTCFFSSFSSMIDGSSCFSGSATGTSAVSDFSLLRLFLFSFFLSFSCFSFLSDLSLRCLRLDSLDSVF